MKAIKSFILLMLLASSSLTFSQGNIFPEGRKWIIREYKINPTVNYNNIITCLVSGDTILAGHSYKKVHFTNHATNDTDVSMLIRRDGSKIYQRYGSYGKWNPDTLVFDENWQKGDKTTLPFGHNADGTISSYAEIFETGQIEGRKYWNINDSYTWVQDVGYITTRLFFDAYGINYGGSLYDVICCVEANGDTLYVNRDILHFSSATNGYRREIHLVETNMPYLYFPTGEGVYIIKSGYETLYYPFADSSGRSKPTYQFYSAGFPIIDVVCNRGFTPPSYVAATTNVGDSNLLLYVDRNGTTDITPAFIAKGSKSRIEQIEMQNGDGLLPSKYDLSVFLSVSGNHAGVYRHSQITSATKYYPEWSKIFDGQVNFISADAYGYEFVICYDDSLGNSRIIVSDDLGMCEKWRELYCTNRFKISKIERSGNFCCLYGKDTLVISTDNGNTWKECHTPFLVSDIVYTVTRYGEERYDEIYAAEASDTISRMWLSQDLGATWSVQHTIADDPTGIVDMCLGTNCAYSFVMYTGAGKIYSLLHDYGNISGNKDREILFNGIATAINKDITAEDFWVTITPADGGCLVTLDTDTGEWTATLYNSNGVTVAQQLCSGSEAFLPTDSKGTHILVVKAGGRVVKKKIMLR